MSTEPEPTQGEPKPSPYIRTFAKDFAALAAQNPGIAAANKSKQKKNPPAKKPLHTVQAPKPIKSELDQEAESIDARTRDEVLSVPVNDKPEKIESIDLPEIDPGDIFTKSSSLSHETPVPTPVSMMPDQAMQFEEKPPSEPAPMAASAAANEPTDAQRAEILARLKAKASTHVTEVAKETVPTASIPVPAPTIPAPRIERPPVIIEPPPLKVEAPKTAANSPIHTYKSDFSDHVEENNASAFSIIAAQKDAPQKVIRPAPKKSATLVIVMSILLLLVGGSGVFAAYLFMNKSAPVLLTPTINSLIASDTQVKLDGTGPDLMKDLAATAKDTTADGTVIMTYIDTATTTAQGVTEGPASGGAFITELNLQAPDILLRNIDPSSMVGVVHANTQTAPFFILRVTSYERTFAGMLQWESSMFNALNVLYPQYTNVAVQATSTSSTTPSKIFIPPTDPTEPATQFVDEIVANRSVRALKDNAGRTLVLYGYVDKQTLIIARNEDAFGLLVEKLTATGN